MPAIPTKWLPSIEVSCALPSLSRCDFHALAPQTAEPRARGLCPVPPPFGSILPRIHFYFESRSMLLGPVVDFHAPANAKVGDDPHRLDFSSRYDDMNRLRIGERLDQGVVRKLPPARIGLKPLESKRNCGALNYAVAPIGSIDLGDVVREPLAQLRLGLETVDVFQQAGYGWVHHDSGGRARRAERPHVVPHQVVRRIDDLTGSDAGNTAPPGANAENVVGRLESHLNMHRIPTVRQSLFVFSKALAVVLEVAAKSFPRVDVVAQIASRFGHQGK